MPVQYLGTTFRCLCLSLILLALLCLASDAFALSKTEKALQREGMLCTNCSEFVTQQLERIISLEQLSQLRNQVSEAVSETAQQIRMVQQNIEQYANMLQNTAQLPAALVTQFQGEFSRLASLSSVLKTQRGDMMALERLFMNLYPEQSLFRDLAGASPAQVEEANARYELEWNKWAANVDQAAQATFQLSGQQLAELQQDPQRFQQYIDALLSSPDGLQKALMAGNQLASLQTLDARQLRELMATRTQSALASQMKDEKESQMRQELWRDVSKTGRLDELRSKPDPF
jgi:P-type conjugative transfer protein TrbJ